MKPQAGPSDGCEGSARPGAVVELAYYTDPLCCWSWGFEPKWRRLRYQYGYRLGWCYLMAGMMAGWNGYQDPINAISRPAQMGQVWMQARHVSGIADRGPHWLEDPPSSSYPACLAVKAADLQSAAAGERLLRRLREAVMAERRNVRRREVILAVGEELASDDMDPFNSYLFRRDLDGHAVLDACGRTSRSCATSASARFPALTLRCAEGPGVIIVGPVWKVREWPSSGRWSSGSSPSDAHHSSARSPVVISEEKRAPRSGSRLRLQQAGVEA